MAKIYETCLDAALVQRLSSARTHLSSRVKYIGSFWIQEFCKMTKRGFEILLQKLAPESEG